jgi:hypothetical protein
MNKKFTQEFNNEERISFQDCTQIIHAFSLMDLLAKEKFVQICLRIYERAEAMEKMSPIDVS